MAKLESLMTVRKHSRATGRRRYTALDMSIVKHDAAVRASRIRRGEIVRGTLEYIACCGCGAEGCFIHGGESGK